MQLVFMIICFLIFTLSINSRYNPDFAAWSVIKNSIGRQLREFLKTKSMTIQKFLKPSDYLIYTAAAGSDLRKRLFG